MKANANLNFGSHGGTTQGLPAPSAVTDASRKQEMDDHKAETIIIAGATRIHGLGVAVDTDVFASVSGKTVNLPANWGGSAYYAVLVLPTADPDGYLGEVWVIKGASSYIVYNSGSATGAFLAVAVKFDDIP